MALDWGAQIGSWPLFQIKKSGEVPPQHDVHYCDSCILRTVSSSQESFVESQDYVVFQVLDCLGELHYVVD